MSEIDVFTIGQIAVICGVHSRYVSKWFDSGRLKGYRIPGTQERRIPRECLIRFLKEHGMSLDGLREAEQDPSVVAEYREAAYLGCRTYQRLAKPEKSWVVHSWRLKTTGIDYLGGPIIFPEYFTVGRRNADERPGQELDEAFTAIPEGRAE